MDPVTGLAYGRLGVGLVSFLTPGLATKLLLLDKRANPQLPYLTRMFGSREIALGVITLAAPQAARERLVQLGIAVDGADVLTGVAATFSGTVPKKAGLMMTLVAAGAVASGVMSLTEES
jgi:hypothetical protein